MALIYSDTFTDSNGVSISSHVADTGQTYSAGSGLKINNNRLYCSNTALELTEVVGAITDPEFTLTLDYYKYTDIGYNGIVFCADATGQNGHLVRVRQSNYLELWDIIDGSYIFKYRYTFTLSSGPLSQIKVEARADEIRVYYGESQVITYANSDQMRNGGKIFFRGILAVGIFTGYHLDAISYSDEVSLDPITIPLDYGTYSVEATATAPDLSTDIDAGTLQVVDHIGSSNTQAQISTHSASARIVFSGAAANQAQYSNHSASGSIVFIGQSVAQAEAPIHNATGTIEQTNISTENHQAQTATQTSTGSVVFVVSGDHQSDQATQSASGNFGYFITGAGDHQAQIASNDVSGKIVIIGSGDHYAQTATHHATDVSVTPLPIGKKSIRDITHQRGIFLLN